MSYDIDPEKRTELLENAACAGSEEIAGVTLRPMTATTFSLWNRFKSQLLEDGSDWALSAFAFAHIHSVPKEKLRAAYIDPKALLGEIYAWMDTRQASDAALFLPFMSRQMEQFQASDSRVLRSTAEDALDPKT